MNYKDSLKEWMSQHMLTPLDVRDILREMRLDDDNRRKVRTAEDIAFEDVYARQEEKTHR